MSDYTLTRRGALVALGALAGCSATTPLGDGRTELDGRAIRVLVDDSVPAVPERLPVGVGTAHLEASEERARALLDAVPASLGPDDLPNGAMRERIRRKREYAVEGLDAENTPAAEALEELYRPIDARHDDRWDDEWPARSLHWAHATLIGLRAFASLRARVADGETFAVESADDVATVRREAIDAVRTAAAESTILGRTAPTDAAARLGHADARLTEVRDDVSAVQIRNEVGRYLVVMARARAVSRASERVIEALQS